MSYGKPAFRAPIFVVETKAYLWGRKALELAKTVEKVSKKSGVYFLFVPQLVDVRLITENVDIPVFAPNIDPIKPGRGLGRDLPEALKDAGVAGTILNHAERRRTLNEIEGCIRRAREVGLLTIVCCDSPRSAAALAQLQPEAILSEPPELIGTLKSVVKEMRSFVAESVEAVKKVNERVLVIVGAGVSSGEDAAQILKLGADGTGAARAICESRDPEKLLSEIAEAMEKEWERRDE